MGYKDILVYLDPTPSCLVRVKVALQIALVDGAYLTGVDASTDEAFAGDFRDKAMRIEEDFRAALAAEGVAGDFLVAAARDRPADHLLPADLVIAPSPLGEARALIQPALPDAIVKLAGAPVLAFPTDWAGASWGEHVVIAWNASREAMRAVREALPILQRARRVTIFVFSREGSALRASADRLAVHLARHGANAEVSDWTHTGDVSAIEALFADLDTQRADLIVAGGFGHARLFEGLFGGGMSVHLLRQPSLPVLMSH